MIILTHVRNTFRATFDILLFFSDVKEIWMLCITRDTVSENMVCNPSTCSTCNAVHWTNTTLDKLSNMLYINMRETIDWIDKNNHLAWDKRQHFEKSHFISNIWNGDLVVPGHSIMFKYRCLNHNSTNKPPCRITHTDCIVSFAILNKFSPDIIIILRRRGSMLK